MNIVDANDCLELSNGTNIDESISNEEWRETDVEADQKDFGVWEMQLCVYVHVNIK